LPGVWKRWVGKFNMIIPMQEVYKIIKSVDDTECSCEKCVKMCANRPCWGIPNDILRLIELGYAKRLMQDYWAGNFSDKPRKFDGSDDYHDIQIISPAIVGREGGGAPFMPFGRCTFLTADNKCEIHACKPTEGRKASCNHNTSVNVHEYIARTWDTPEGRSVVEQFGKLMEQD